MGGNDASLTEVTNCAGVKALARAGPIVRFQREDVLMPMLTPAFQSHAPKSWSAVPPANPIVTGFRPSDCTRRFVAHHAGRRAIGPPRVRRSSSAVKYRCPVAATAQ